MNAAPRHRPILISIRFAIAVFATASWISATFAVADESPAQESRLTKLPDAVKSVVWSPDGKRFASTSIRKTPRQNRKPYNPRFDRWVTVRIHDAKTGAELHSLGELKNPRYEDCKFSPDGKLMALSQSDRFENGHYVPESRVEIRDSETSNLRAEATMDHHLGRPTLAFSPNSETLAVGYGGRNETMKGACLFSATTGREIRTLAETGGYARVIAFSPDGKLIACAGMVDGVIVLWKPDVLEPVRRLSGAHGFPFALAFSPDGATLACAGSRGKAGIQLWDVATGKAKPSPEETPQRCSQVVFSRDGALLAGASPTEADDPYGQKPGKREVRVWSVKSGKLLLTIPDASDSIAFSADSREFHVLTHGKGIRHINVADLSTDATRH